MTRRPFGRLKKFSHDLTRSVLQFIRLKLSRATATYSRASNRTVQSVRSALLFVSRTWKLRTVYFWHAHYSLLHRYRRLRARNAFLIAAIVLVLLATASALVIPTVANVLGSSKELFEALQLLILTLGAALLGAAAIVSSLVLFAVQVNVERMPHGLFRSLSSDWPLLGAFASTFGLAVVIAGLSLVQSRDAAGVLAIGALWGIALTLLLFLYGYRRALRLISPAQQLHFVVASARKNLNAWSRRATRLSPHLQLHDAAIEDNGSQSVDIRRRVFFDANSGWDNEARRAVLYGVSFARRYAEQGDYEIAALALDAVVAINAEYVKAKGRTFFGYVLMVDNPHVTDGFINYTLEELRKTAQIGRSRGDEQQIEQAITAIANLLRIYLTIEYGEHQSKTHAHLALAYLCNEVEYAVPLVMVDVVIHGVSAMGESASALLLSEGPQDILTAIQRIGSVSCAGALNERSRPITKAGVEQLAQLSLALLAGRSREIQHAASEIRKAMTRVVTSFLVVPDSPIEGTHSAYLGPYYSSGSPGYLPSCLRELVHLLLGAEASSADAKRITENLAAWADRIFETEKEVLLKAVAARSHFAFDVIRWIADVSCLLLQASSAPACEEHWRHELRHHATWLISTLSFVPGDQETTKFVEHLQMTEVLFEAAICADQSGCPDAAQKIEDLLLYWMFKAGSASNPGVVEEAACGLAALALRRGDERAQKLKSDMSDRINSGGLCDEEVRQRASSRIRERAQGARREFSLMSPIERIMRSVDRAQLNSLLAEIANLLSANSPV